MPYRYATERMDGSDFASGYVLHSAPRHPAFPVRLAVEMFLRARARLPADAPVTLWDPCCGSGHLLTALGWTRRRDIGRVVASDADADSLTLARKNLKLLTPEGLRDRAAERRDKSARFGKPGYADAARAAERIGSRLADDGGALPWDVWQADVFDPSALARVVAGGPPDIVLTDVPYAEHTHWSGAVPEQPIPAMLRALAAVLPPHAVLAVADRSRRIPVAPLRPVERMRIGTRSLALLRAADVRQDAGEGG